jgi:RNA polymerase sigma factor (sigma-70 family)
MDETVTDWIRDLRGGDEEAAARIWGRFFERLCRLAQGRLAGAHGAIADEEDVALSAMNAVFSGVREGRFERLEGRDDLWQVLAMITVRKVIDARRRSRRRDEVQEAAIEQEIEQLAEGGAEGASEAEYLDALTEVSRLLLDRLEAPLREVAVLRLEGRSNKEISARVGRSLPTVERHLRMIRHRLSQL